MDRLERQVDVQRLGRVVRRDDPRGLLGVQERRVDALLPIVWHQVLPRRICLIDVPRGEAVRPVVGAAVPVSVEGVKASKGRGHLLLAESVVPLANGMRHVASTGLENLGGVREVGWDAIRVDVLVAVHSKVERVPPREHCAPRRPAHLEGVVLVEVHTAAPQVVNPRRRRHPVDVPQIVVPQVVGHDVDHSGVLGGCGFLWLGLCGVRAAYWRLRRTRVHRRLVGRVVAVAALGG
mmetsp:Transcript_14594/g.37550  ORF Transcript_14594/g.37550 Transcript_14594/m.37550 type:complete len:236 (-) Transcript_14594:346-1053(-)